MRLDASPYNLQPGVHMGPATVNLVDIADTGSMLREASTTSWKKAKTEQAYDFPNSYVNLPLRVMSFDPINTTADDQNRRFAQRYFSK